ncbi:PREDICTED: separase-like [Camelina sativa]|uniref:Separase-like n=1 Tax=Camelina sativa TaxID=90675 RepID=A0ABM1QQL9_CAMSA|nr:PREDICTED: separase-like [Camelina sativa]
MVILIALTTWQAMPQENVILRLYSAGLRTLDKECLGTDFDKTLLNVAIAAFIISTRTQRKVEVKCFTCNSHKSVEVTNRLVEDVISSPGISPPELKYLLASFHDIGIELYNMKHLKEASTAFKLCIRAVWTCVRLLFHIYVNESDDLTEGSLPGEAIIDFVSDACSKSEFYLDVLQQQHGTGEIENLLFFILENWSAAEDIFKKLPDPTPIIKQWVKIQHRHKFHKRERVGTFMADTRDGDACTMQFLITALAKKKQKTCSKIYTQES